MVSFDFEELLGTDAFFGKQIARGARNLACTVWNKYPDQWTKGDPLTSPVKFFWNSICAEEGINKQPIPQDFSGGQCPAVYTFRLRLFIPPSTYLDFGLNFLAHGPLGGVRLGRIDQYQQAIDVFCFGNASSTGRLPEQQWIEFTRTNNEPTKVTPFNIVRQDGQPDNCGNPPPYFPTTQPPPPGAENTTVTINDGGDTDLTVPISWFDVDFSVPITFSFEVGDVIVDVGGVTINFNKNNDWNLNDNPEPVSLPDAVNDQLDDIQDTIKDVNDVLENDRKPFSENDYNPTVNDETEEEDVTDSEIEFVKVTVVNFPINGKTIVNKSISDTFFWAGYFCWTVEGARTTHVVVQKTENVYKKPSWATGYALFAVNGAVLQTTTFKRKLQE